MRARKRLFSIYTIAMRGIVRRPFRYGVMFFSIVVMSGLISSLALMNSAVEDHVGRTRARFGADIIVAPEGNAREAEEVLLEPATHEFYMSRSILGRIGNMPMVDEITAHTYLNTISSDCCGLPFDTKVIVFDQDTDFIVTPWLRKAIHRTLRRDETIAGIKAEEYYNLLDFDSSVLFNRPFIIAGVLDEIGSGLDYALFIEDGALPNILESAHVGFGMDEISLIFIRVREGIAPEAAAKLIRQEVPGVDVITRSGMGQDLVAMLGDLLGLIKMAAVIIGFIGISLSWATYSAIMNERMREFAILRFLGARRPQVLSLIGFEALLLGMTASCIGAASGVCIVLLAPFQIGMIGEALRILDPWTLGYSMAVGFACGIMVPVVGIASSAWRVFRLDPHMEMKGV